MAVTVHGIGHPGFIESIDADSPATALCYGVDRIIRESWKEAKMVFECGDIDDGSHLAQYRYETLDGKVAVVETQYFPHSEEYPSGQIFCDVHFYGIPSVSDYKIVSNTPYSLVNSISAYFESMHLSVTVSFAKVDMNLFRDYRNTKERRNSKIIMFPRR